MPGLRCETARVHEFQSEIYDLLYDYLRRPIGRDSVANPPKATMSPKWNGVPYVAVFVPKGCIDCKYR